MMKLVGLNLLFLPILVDAIQYDEILSIAPIKLAKSFSYLVSMDAIFCTFCPVTALSWFGIKIDQGSINQYFCEAAGFQAAGLAITSYLVTSQKTSIERAIAYGHLARILGVSKMFVSGNMFKLDFHETSFLIVTSTLLALVHNIFLEVWEPMLCSIIIAILMTLQSTMVLFNPSMGTKFMKTHDIKDKTPRFLRRASALYMFLSGLYTILIGFKIDPIKAVGFTSMAALLFQPYKQTMELKCCFGMSKESMILLNIVLLGTISAGTLL